MKITVIGAGVIGSAVANDLLEVDDVAQVCDARVRSLRALRGQVQQQGRLRSFQVDTRSLSELDPIIADSDCARGRPAAHARL